MSDQTIYKFSESQTTPERPFKRKIITWIQDQAATGNYSGNQVTFNNAGLANSDLWTCYKDAYFAIPWTISLVSTVDVTTLINPYSIGMKSGFWNLVDSWTVDYNGHNIIQNSPFTNVYANFRALTTWSQDSLNKYGLSFGFFPDTITSYQYGAAVAAAGGPGYTNNRNFASAQNFVAAEWTGTAFNEGYLRRQVVSGYTANPLTLLLPYASAAGLGVTAFSFDAGAAEAKRYYWTGIAKVRLADLSDFFEKMPICRGAYFTITLNLNTTTTVIRLNARTMINITGVAPTTSLINSRGTCPFLVASSAATQGMGVVAINAADVTISLKIGAATAPAGGVTQAFTTCRLYVPQYELDSVHAEAFLSMNPTRRVVYRDIQMIQTSPITNGSQITSLLNNGIPNPKRVIVVPFIAGTSNDGVYTEYQNCFSSAPSTTSPLAAIQYFQVQLGSKMMFQTQQQYDFDTFQSELAKSGLNGGELMELGSGLISEYMFQTGYRYYVCDLSREPATSVPQAVQIYGTNVSGLTCIYFAFIEWEKFIEYETATGAYIASA